MTEQSIAQQTPLLTDDLPPASQIALLDRAVRQGRSSDWIMERLNGIQPRHALTDALKKAVEYIDPKGNQSSFMGKKMKEGETPEGKFNVSYSFIFMLLSFCK